MRVFVPEIGTVLTLAKDWTFRIINERRNGGLAKLLNSKSDRGDYYYPFGTTQNPDIEHEHYGYTRIPVDPGMHTLSAGTNLEVDRIYVRKGNEEFSSITFKMHVGSKVVRFFAKLDDVNKIEL